MSLNNIILMAMSYSIVYLQHNIYACLLVLGIYFKMFIFINEAQLASSLTN